MLQQANADFEKGGWHSAAEAFEQLYSQASDAQANAKGKYAYMAGESFRLSNNPKKAIEYFDKAVILKYADKHEEVFLKFGDAYVALEEFEDAIEQFQEFESLGGSKSVARSRIAQAEEASKLKAESDGRYVIEPLVLLNMPGFDMTPVISGKKSDELIFSSNRRGTGGDEDCAVTGGLMFDLYFSELDKKGRWSTPSSNSFGKTVNTEEAHESSPVFDSRQKYMYFTRCIGRKCDLYKVKQQSGEFGASERLDIVDRNTDDSTKIAHPTMLTDEVLIFASNMAGGQGGMDLWYLYGEDGDFTESTPVNLGPEINTSGSEVFPSVRADGTLYWSTDGRTGLGGLDLWKATIGEGEGLVYTNAEMLPYPMNSSSDDFSITFWPEMEAGIFASNRPGGKGADDLYEFKLLPLEFCYMASVYDAETNNALANATITITSDGGDSYSYTTDESGELTLCDGEIEEEMSYSIEVQVENYIAVGDFITTKGLNQSTTFPHDFPLREVVINKAMEFEPVYYPLGSAELLNNETYKSNEALDVLVRMMEQNPSFVIQLDAHTDSRGSASSNKALSQARAETCVKYLINEGIAEDRLVAKGYGEDVPKVSEAEIASLPESEQEAAHQKNRRTEFQVLRVDYKSGN